MATQATVELVGIVLKQLDQARSLELQIHEHFGDSSVIGDLAYRAEQGLLNLFIGIAKDFKDGLTMQSSQLYNLGRLFAVQDALKKPGDLAKYLNDITGGVVTIIESSGADEFRMVFDRERVKR